MFAIFFVEYIITNTKYDKTKIAFFFVDLRQAAARSDRTRWFSIKKTGISNYQFTKVGKIIMVPRFFLLFKMILNW